MKTEIITELNKSVVVTQSMIDLAETVRVIDTVDHNWFYVNDEVYGVAENGSIIHEDGEDYRDEEVAKFPVLALVLRAASNIV